MDNVYHGGYEFMYDENLIFREKINSFNNAYGGDKGAYRQIEIRKGEVLKLELWEYEAAVFEIFKKNEKTN